MQRQTLSAATLLLISSTEAFKLSNLA